MIIKENKEVLETLKRLGFEKISTGKNVPIEKYSDGDFQFKIARGRMHLNDPYVEYIVRRFHPACEEYEINEEGELEKC